ncbi:MAG: hypothetical protein ACYC3I_25985 [Gemmataceae bacterium]
MMRLASLVCGLLSIALLGYAGYCKFAESEPPQAAELVVQDPERDLGSQPCGEMVAVQFRIKNPSAQSIRIVGLVPG